MELIITILIIYGIWLGIKFLWENALYIICSLIETIIEFFDNIIEALKEEPTRIVYQTEEDTKVYFNCSIMVNIHYLEGYVYYEEELFRYILTPEEKGGVNTKTLLKSGNDIYLCIKKENIWLPDDYAGINLISTRFVDFYPVSEKDKNKTGKPIEEMTEFEILNEKEAEKYSSIVKDILNYLRPHVFYQRCRYKIERKKNQIFYHQTKRPWDKPKKTRYNYK